MEIRWDPRKEASLKKSRGVSFDEILQARLIAVERHATRRNQLLMLFRYKGYVWVVPFVEDAKGIFLKTLFPSRRFTKRLREGGRS